MTGSRNRDASRGGPGAYPCRVLAFVLAIFSGVTWVCADGDPSGSSLIAPLADRSLLVDIASVGDRVVVVGERGNILVGDGRDGWRQSRVPVRTMLTGVHMLDMKTGWAVGHDAVILRTLDGGETWETMYSDPALESPLLDVWFADQRRGFAVGAYSLFLETDDGGSSWRARTFEPATEAAADGAVTGGELDADDFSDVYDFHLNSLAPGGNGTLYIAAEGGNLYRSDDGGVSWREMTSPYRGSFFGILPLGEGEGLLAFGLRGHLYRSEDGGATWDRIETGVKEMLTDGVQLNDGSIVIVGLGGTVLRSDDGGHRFELTRLPDRHGLSAVVQTDDGRVLAVGEGGVARLTPGGSR